MRRGAHVLLVVASCSSASRAEPRPPHPAAEPRASIVTSTEAIELGDIAEGDPGLVLVGTARGTLTIPGRPPQSFVGGFLLGLDSLERTRFFTPLAGDTVFLEGLETTSSGAHLLAGFFSGEMRVGERVVIAESETDGFVASMDRDGRLSWLTIVGGPGKQMLRRLDVEGDRVLAVGSFEHELAESGITSRGSTDVCVIDLDVADGKVHASRAFGSTGEDIGRDLAVSAGRVVVVGHYDTAFELGERVALPPPRDLGGFVVSMDRAGAAQWALALDDPGLDVIKQVVPHRDGWVFTRVSQPDAPPPGVAGFASDNLMVGHVAAVGRDGALRWSWTDPDVASAHGLAIEGDDVLVVGHHRDGFSPGGAAHAVRGRTGFFALRLSGDGVVGTGFACDGSGDDHGDAVALASDGSVSVAGITSAPSDCAPGINAPAIGFVRTLAL